MRKKSTDQNQTQIAELQEQLKIMEENWKRALADYHNIVKKSETDRKTLVLFVTSQVIGHLLPALDILELAAAHNPDQGLQLSLKQFQSVLKDEGVHEISPASGVQFDPTFHECIELLAGEPDQTIAEVVQKGYKMNDQFVIRPAKVKVFKLALDK